MNREELMELAEKANCEVHIEQDEIDENHTSSLWYGGYIASVYFPNGVVGDISADGEVRATLLDEDCKEELVDVVDKNSSGRFYEEMKDYIKSDVDIGRKEAEGRLVFENNNWYEITARDLDGNFVDLGWCAESDSLYEAIAECIEGMPSCDGFDDGFVDEDDM